jgi:ribose 5-phosphate isomerase A
MCEKNAWREEAKKKAASSAVKEVKKNFVVGLGSGSTVAYVIRDLGRRNSKEDLQISGIPTSHQALLLAVENRVPLTTLNENPKPDLMIDGADQIDKRINLIKGMGGALTREKIVAYASNKVIIVADETKLVEKLGVNHPLPIELLPIALPLVTLRIREMGGIPVLREAKQKVGPVVTDNNNFIVDAHFGAIDTPRELNLTLKEIPGVIETGLFIEIADTAYIGKPNTVQEINRKR